MLYLLAVVLPPLACLFVGRPLVALLLLLLQLTCIGWPLAAIVAMVIVADTRADHRARRYTPPWQGPYPPRWTP